MAEGQTNERESDEWTSGRRPGCLDRVSDGGTRLWHEPMGVGARQKLTVLVAVSMAISLAIVDALGQLVGDLSIKWPNDIYWRNGKLAGILIENTLKGNLIKESVIGVGLNVNQRAFHSDAPNPVSLWQITGQETDRVQLLHSILQAFDKLLGQDVHEQYLLQLYRRKGFHPYADKDGAFMAEIGGVEDDGHLLLNDEDGQQRRYAFKEVQFII